jgi:hypothetical protein
MKLAFKKSRYLRSLAVIAALLVVLMAQPALAVTNQWIGPTTNNLWNNPANWSLAHVPVAGEDAFATDGTQTITYANAANPLLNSVIVDSAGGTMTLTQTYYPTGNLTASAETIGKDGKGVYNQNAGTNAVGSAAAVNPLPAGTIDRTLVLGFNDGSSGTYNKTGGTLTAGAVIVGRDGTGFFNLSSSPAVSVGTVQPDGTEPFSLIVGGIYNGNAPRIIGEGTVKLSSSTLNVAGGAVIGQTGKGTLTASSSNLSVGGYFIVGNWDGSVGEATISSSTFKVGGSEHIGDTGTGKMTLSSSSHEIGGDLFVGKFAGSMGDYTASSSSIKVKGNATIGGAGPGTFKASSSSITVDGDYTLGDNASGTQTLSSSSLKVKGDEVIGNNGPATFTSNSSSNSANTIIIAQNAPATYNMNNSSMTATDPAAPANAIWVKGPYDGNIPSLTGGNLLIGGTSTVNGNVTNDGLIKTTGANVTFNGVVTNNSAYVSDPGSVQTFSQDLVISDTGYLVATADVNAAKKSRDKFIIKEDFVITGVSAAQETAWDTHNALLNFNKGTDKIHDLSVAGAQNGRPGINGGGPSNVVTDNYAWGSLDITNQTINLIDPDATVGALYVNYYLTGVTTLGTVVTNINNTSGHNLRIYYNNDLGFNPGLSGDYTWNSGGGGLFRYHTPLPPSVLLMGSGLLGLGLLGWRRRRLKG